MVRKAVIVTAILALSQCSPKPAEAPAPAAPKPVDFSYDIALHVKPEAAAKAQTLTISAKYYGLPVPETMHLANAGGAIEFNTDTVEVAPRDQTVHMTGDGMPKDRVKDINTGSPLVQITVKDKAGRVQCSVFQDYVKTAQAKPVAIYCGPA
ncbi:hypothetical protein [Asticcacaulis sp. 201]|uniref:hypothetical protein n=1 Tax=Asticcacaulis sp. 201 TaxID=3028787 RepID=UPI0029165DCD|nr:hypothetical protein [Asticcacaulis sp. 201]MDV6332484.1 hypothetical protein [Asticcacaulis sp. 201]